MHAKLLTISAITSHVTGSDEGNSLVAAWPVILKNTEVVVIWGADPINTNQIAWGVADHESYIYFRKLKEQMKKCYIIPSTEGEWKNRSNTVIPVSRILDCINNPDKEVDFNCKKITYPTIKMAYWAGGNPFHEKLDTFIMQDCF